MFNNVRNRITAIVLLLLALFVTLFYLSLFSQNRILTSLINKDIQDRNKLVDISISMLNQGLVSYVFENTYWDDMVDFVKNPSKVWADDNLALSMQNYKFDYVWIYDENLKMVYYIQADASAPLSVLPLEFSDLEKLLNKNWFNQFFIRDTDNLIHVLTAPVQPSNDSKRITKPVGYMITGKRWSSSYLEELAGLLLSETRLVIPEKFQQFVRNSSKDKYNIFTSKELKDWQGKTISYLISSYQNTTLKETDFSSRSNFTFVFIFSLLLMSVIIICLYLWIVKPLAAISYSLAEEDINKLASIEKQNTEFGRLAILIKEFFRQKAFAIEQRNAFESFSYSVSHDLRAPIRAIVGYSQILKEDLDGEIDEGQTSFLKRIIRAAKKMDEVIGALLELSRITRQNLKIEHFNFSDLCDELVADIKEQSHKDSIKSYIERDIFITADRKMISIAMMNLIGNAVKFSGKTDNSEIHIGSKKQNDQLVYFVRDNGIGFDMKYESKLFSDFGRLHSEEEYPGTGIGLSIVNRIIKRHGGRVWAESEPGKGATFYFTIPALI